VVGDGVEVGRDVPGEFGSAVDATDAAGPHYGGERPDEVR
jgi:hypothetical protein